MFHATPACQTISSRRIGDLQLHFVCRVQRSDKLHKCPHITEITVMVADMAVAFARLAGRYNAHQAKQAWERNRQAFKKDLDPRGWDLAMAIGLL